jgi:hypothetical protein
MASDIVARLELGMTSEMALVYSEMVLELEMASEMPSESHLIGHI